VRIYTIGTEVVLVTTVDGASTVVVDVVVLVYDSSAFAEPRAPHDNSAVMAMRVPNFLICIGHFLRKKKTAYLAKNL
jgi:hypothetical protein